MQNGDLKKADVPFLWRNCIQDSWDMLRTTPPRRLAAIGTCTTYAHDNDATVRYRRFELSVIRFRGQKIRVLVDSSILTFSFDLLSHNQICCPMIINLAKV